MTTYSLFEGNFLSASPILDRSVNILMFRDPDNKEYNIIINRALLDEDQSIEKFCEAQVEVLRFQLPGFQIEGKLLEHEIGPAKLAVGQIANRYLDAGKTVRQVQSIMQLPFDQVTNPSGRALLIFTLHSLEEFTEHQRKHYVQIINSFNPDTTL